VQDQPGKQSKSSQVTVHASSSPKPGATEAQIDSRGVDAAGHFSKPMQLLVHMPVLHERPAASLQLPFDSHGSPTRPPVCTLDVGRHKYVVSPALVRV